MSLVNDIKSPGIKQHRSHIFYFLTWMAFGDWHWSRSDQFYKQVDLRTYSEQELVVMGMLLKLNKSFFLTSWLVLSKFGPVRPIAKLLWWWGYTQNTVYSDLVALSHLICYSHYAAVPAGSSCPSLEGIDHGGVIYTDLILSIGVQANYVCFNGYSLHGHRTYECSNGNEWIRTDDQSSWKNTAVPTCEG